MKILWSVPTRGVTLASNRGDMIRASRLVGGLREEGHEVVVAASGGTVEGRAAVAAYRGFVSRLVPRAAALALRDTGRWLVSWRHGARLAEQAAELRPDVLIETQAHLSFSGSVAARRSGLPLVLDDVAPVSEELSLGVASERWVRRQFSHQLAAATALVVPSQPLADLLRAEGVRHRDLWLVPNGYDEAAFERARASRRDRGDGPLVVGFVGSFQPWHRVDLLVEAVARLRRSHDLRLRLVGRGEAWPDVAELVRRLGLGGVVELSGEVAAADVPSLLARMDVGVLPGTEDYGHPMKLVEYAAAGLAIVAPSLRSVSAILEDGSTGLLFPPGDGKALAARLERLLGDPELRCSLGEAARLRVAASAGWRGSARRLGEQLETLL